MKKEPASLSETFLNTNEAVNTEEQDISGLDYEIDLISDPRIKKFVRFLLKNAPVFWSAPATLTADLHPPDEEVRGGLVLHTKRVVRIAMLIATTFDASASEVDCLIAAALLHDVSKFVLEEDDQFLFDPMHPYTVDRYVEWSIEEGLNSGKANEDTTIEVDMDTMELILRLIRCSHGIWSPIRETIPATILERALHEADLIAANLHVLADGNNVKRDKWT